MQTKAISSNSNHTKIYRSTVFVSLNHETVGGEHVKSIKDNILNNQNLEFVWIHIFVWYTWMEQFSWLNYWASGGFWRVLYEKGINNIQIGYLIVSYSFERNFGKRLSCCLSSKTTLVRNSQSSQLSRKDEHYLTQLHNIIYVGFDAVSSVP